MQRRAIAVSGIVQGVGFRPFVFNLAQQLGLSGFVKNQTGGVLIEIEGEDCALDRFLSELTSRPPRLACIDAIRASVRNPVGDRVFRIQVSDADRAAPSLHLP